MGQKSTKDIDEWWIKNSKKPAHERGDRISGCYDYNLENNSDHLDDVLKKHFPHKNYEPFLSVKINNETLEDKFVVIDKMFKYFKEGSDKYKGQSLTRDEFIIAGQKCDRLDADAGKLINELDSWISLKLFY